MSGWVSEHIECVAVRRVRCGPCGMPIGDGSGLDAFRVGLTFISPGAERSIVAGEHRKCRGILIPPKRRVRVLGRILVGKELRENTKISATRGALDAFS